MLIKERRATIPIKKDGKIKVIIKLSLPFAIPDEEKKGEVLTAERFNAFYFEIEEKYKKFLNIKEPGLTPLIAVIGFDLEIDNKRIKVTRKTEIRGESKAFFTSNDTFDATLGYLLPERKQKRKKNEIKPQHVKKQGN